ncbi:hypothetical protein BWI15_01165 [Kribbella sp. ALI-6-A]|uniref:MFS transporter n=1 Tax=Kribbella sp. ALI-6-A TaxID=1933817 RepID=UPI00097C1271|nr:MFS transporter [Kribbella sp. ALI-6-A]ONI78510.1 hypothetical protein BWI15_01165 [Kribbella sp. ALI-6-A]
MATPTARPQGTGRMTGAQCGIVGLCLLVAVMDGLDAQLIAYAAPAIVKEFGFGPAAFGVVFSASLLGMALGSVLFGMLADRYGRKRSMIAAITLFAVATLLIPLAATNIPSFLALRFVAGLGLGGVTPSLIALIAENTPQRVRSMAIMVAVGSLSLGAFFGGLLAAWMIPAHGWRSIFVLGGVVPVLLVVAMAAGLRSRADVRDPAAGTSPATSSAQLLRDGRAPGTIVLWIVFFTNLLLLFSLLNWLPTLFLSAGLTAKAALTGSSVFALGGFTGGLVMGALIDRTGRSHAVLVIGYALGIAGIGIVTTATDNVPLLMAGIVLAGVGVAGGQTGISALAASLYPPSIRGAGIGWAYGVGRVGSIVGPAVSGFLVASGLGATSIIGLAVVPAAIAGTGVATLAVLGRRRTSHSGLEEFAPRLGAGPSGP